jgi:hypothetical protein
VRGFGKADWQVEAVPYYENPPAVLRDAIVGGIQGSPVSSVSKRLAFLNDVVQDYTTGQRLQASHILKHEPTGPQLLKET